MHSEVKVEEVLWEVLEVLEEADLAQEDQVQALEEAPWVGLVDHLVAKEVSWMHLEVKVEEVLWEALEDLEEADLAQEGLAQVQVEVQWEDQEAVDQAQEVLVQVQEDLAQAQEEAQWVGLVDHLVAKEVSWMHLEVKVEEVLWEVLEVLEEADLAQEDQAQVQVVLAQVQEDHLVAKEVSWMHLEV